MIIVTGASRGLGKAILNRLNLLGHETCGISRDITSIRANHISVTFLVLKMLRKLHNH